MKEQLCDDDRRRLEWIECRLGQLGIDVRQSGLHRQMRYYLELLNQQIAITREFLEEDGAAGLETGTWADTQGGSVRELAIQAANPPGQAPGGCPARTACPQGARTGEGGVQVAEREGSPLDEKIREMKRVTERMLREIEKDIGPEKK